MIWKNRQSIGGDIYSLTSWLHIVNRLFGFWPFTIEFNTRGANNRNQSFVCVKAWDWIWFVLSLVIYGSFNIILINMALNAQDTPDLYLASGSKLIEIVIANITTLCSILVGFLSIIMDMINRTDIWWIINTFNEFDEEVKFYIRINRSSWDKSVFIPDFRWRNWDTNLITIITRNGCLYPRQLHHSSPIFC